MGTRGVLRPISKLVAREAPILFNGCSNVSRSQILPDLLWWQQMTESSRTKAAGTPGYDVLYTGRQGKCSHVTLCPGGLHISRGFSYLNQTHLYEKGHKPLEGCRLKWTTELMHIENQPATLVQPQISWLPASPGLTRTGGRGLRYSSTVIPDHLGPE